MGLDPRTPPVLAVPAPPRALRPRRTHTGKGGACPGYPGAHQRDYHETAYSGDPYIHTSPVFAARRLASR
jgi:hypothetical protein